MRRFQGTALLALFAVGFAFNIDVKRAVVHRHTADTYFGYSLDIYQDATQSLLVDFACGLIVSPCCLQTARWRAQSANSTAERCRRRRCIPVYG
jgi:hypothetical protein